jgi:prepilin-type N-terminal cleavage/methylation domain-containing protein
MKFFRPKNRKAGFTLVEIMIVVLIIGILLAIAIPNFVSARESARAKSCVGNLKQIDSATQQYCMDKKMDATKYTATPPTIDTVAATGLVGTTGYIRSAPGCPSGGTYAVAAAITGSPTCSVPTTNSTDANYTSGGKFYHGL